MVCWVVQGHRNWYQSKAMDMRLPAIVLHCHIPIFSHLRGITIYWSKTFVFTTLPTLVSLKLSPGVLPYSWSQKPRLPALPAGENCMILWQFVFTGYRLVTNRRTDGRTAPPVPKHSWARQKWNKSAQFLRFKLEGHSVERIYLWQRLSDGSVNKTILKPRLAVATRRQYV